MFEGWPYSLNKPQSFHATSRTSTPKTTFKTNNQNILIIFSFKSQCGDYANRMCFEQQEHLLKKDKAVVVISENGLDAGSAGVALQKIGIDEVYLLRNGLISWQEESLPLIK